MPKMPYNVDTDMNVYGDLNTTENVNVSGTLTLDHADIIFTDSENNYPSDQAGVRWDLNSNTTKIYVEHLAPASPSELTFTHNNLPFFKVNSDGLVTINDQYTLPTSGGNTGQTLVYSSGELTWSDISRSVISEIPPETPNEGDLWFDAGSTYRLYVYSATADVWIDANPNDSVDVEISDTPPSNPLDGSLWFDTSVTFRLYVYSGVSQTWIDASPSDSPSVTISNNPPVSPLDGELWFDAGSTYRLYIYTTDSGVWIDASPKDTIDSDSISAIYRSLVNEGEIKTPVLLETGYIPSLNDQTTAQAMLTSVGSSYGHRMPSGGEIVSFAAQCLIDVAVSSQFVQYILFINDSDSGIAVNVDSTSVGLQGNEVTIPPIAFNAGDRISTKVKHSLTGITSSEHSTIIKLNTL